MSLFDDVMDYAGTVDPSEEKLIGHGFDPGVCLGCPHRMDDTRGAPCDLCGCPTVEGLLMDRLDAPPESCIRLEEHERRG